VGKWILVFFLSYEIRRRLLSLMTLPLIRKVPPRIHIILFHIMKVICVLVLSKVAVAWGYVLMEDLSRAVAQFYPSAGMSGGSSIPPTGNYDFFPVASPQVNETGAEDPGHTVPHGTSSRSIPGPQEPSNEEDPSIGGESVNRIQTRLLLEYHGKKKKRPLPPFHFFSKKAWAIFEGKKKILERMEELDPGGDWIERGASCLRHNNGMEFSIASLEKAFSSLHSEGRGSQYFRDFMEKRDGL
jgi:hypothetical protein